jgi:ribonuclease J
MRARIHRGANEVGGSCVELEVRDGDRLLLDLGLPLNADSDAEAGLPPVTGLRTDDDATLRGVLLSHAHPDHYGLIEQTASTVPVFMGAATARILEQAAFFTQLGLARTPAVELKDREPFRVGPFTITPYLVDHSAFDAYAFLVDADDRRLFYSGDLRSHGRKPGAFARLLEEPPRQVDALLLEGTTVGRKASSPPMSESDVEQTCVRLIRGTPGLALACYSGQNIDRLVSIYRAAVRAERDLIIDLYGAAIAAATGRETVPQGHWERVRVFVTQAQRVKIKESEEFWRVNELGDSRIYAEEIVEDPSCWVMTFRTSMANELGRAGCLDHAKALWLMWPGYLEGETGDRTRRVFERTGIPLKVVHASGHATVEDLQQLASAIAADRVVPIHTDAPDKFPTLFERVEPHPDGEWWEV